MANRLAEKSRWACGFGSSEGTEKGNGNGEILYSHTELKPNPHLPLTPSTHKSHQTLLLGEIAIEIEIEIEI